MINRPLMIDIVYAHAARFWYGAVLVIYEIKTFRQYYLLTGGAVSVIVSFQNSISLTYHSLERIQSIQCMLKQKKLERTSVFG